MSGSPPAATQQPIAPALPPPHETRPLHVIANLLSATSNELESTKAALEASELRNASLQSIVDSLRAVANSDDGQAVLALQAKIEALTQQRDDEVARRICVQSLWTELKSYLSYIDAQSLDARLGFERVMQAGGGELVLAPVHAVGDVDLTRREKRRSDMISSGSRRHRADSGSYPAAKRLRTAAYQNHPETIHLEPQPQPQFSLSPYRPRHRNSDPRDLPKRTRSRSSSRSSARSMDVDEMLIQATASGSGRYPPGQEGHHRHPRYHDDQQPGPPPQYNTYPQPHQSLGHHRPRPHESNRYPESPPYPASSKISSSSHYSRPLEQQDTHPANAYPIDRAAPYQTHTFAPVVTGAPVKKGKYSMGSMGLSSSAIREQQQPTIGKLGPDRGPLNETPAPSSGSIAPYPPTNSLNQRICRQCGVAGRYKEGKCVEKWGPGPLGPGTVCDRCRKKMKRVERRGTLDGAPVQQMYPPQQQQQQGQPMSERTLSQPWERESQSYREHQHQPPRLAPLQLGPSGTHLNLRSPYPASPVSEHNGRSSIHGHEPAVSSLRASPISPGRPRSGSDVGRMNVERHSRSPSQGPAMQNGSVSPAPGRISPQDDDAEADLLAAVDAAEEMSVQGSVKDEDS